MHLTTSDYLSILRNDLCAFVERSFHELNPGAQYQHNWHLEVIASELEACRRGETKRLIINLPPRSLKSHTVSAAFPAWILGHDPGAQIIAASYGQELASKLAFDCRTLMMSDFYQHLFPTRLSAQRQAVQDFATTANGFRLSTSVGGPLTGRGADYILVDDALKADDALSDSRRKTVNTWFAQTLFSRLNNKRNGCIIVVSQRLHEDDLPGYLLASGGWKLLCFPAIAEEDETYMVQTPYGTRVFQRRAGEALHPQRESLEVLKEIRDKMGEYAFAAQYQQSPAPLGGGIVQTEWFKRYSDDTLPKTFDMVVQSLDSANKAAELNDFSVITTWGVKDNKLYLIEVFRARLEYPDLKRAVTQFAARYQPKVVLIEDRASGTQLIQELRREGIYAVTAYDPKGLEKTMRMRSVTSTIAGGFVFLPENAPWLADYLHELITFPNGKYDDQVDSTSQALDWIKERATECWFYTQCRERAEELQKREREAPNFRNLHEWKNW